MKKSFTFIFVLFFLSATSVMYGQAKKKDDVAQKKSEKGGDLSDFSDEELFELSLEDLLNLDISIASKSAEKISDAPGVVSVVTRDELERFGGVTLKDILERVPSLISSTVYMTDRTTLAARGDQLQPSSSHVLLLINGRPVREALEGGIKSEIYETFPVSLIERIEVIRGPGSVLYGSNAFSAVINVVTEEAGKNKFSATGLAGTPGSFGGQIKGNVNAGDFNLVAGGRYLKQAGWKTDWSYTDPNQSEGYSTREVEIPDEGLGGYLEMNYKNLRLMSSYSQWENYYFISDYAFIFPAHGTASWKKNFNDLGYSVDVSERWKMDFNVTFTNSSFEISSWPNIERNSSEILGEIMQTIKPVDQLGIVVGLLYGNVVGKEIDDTGDEVYTYNDGSQHNMALYTQVDYQFLKSLKVIGGLQANKVENIDLDVVPRGGLIWKPLERLSFKALYSQAFRAPSINELGLQHPALRGNPNLVPEKVSTIDIGWNYQGKQSQVAVNWFHSKQTDIIFQDRSGDMPIYSNIGEVEFQGVEFEGKVYFNEKFFLNGSALYQTNKDKNGVEDVTPIANFGAKGGVSYQSEQVTLSVFNIYQGKLDQDKYGTTLNPSPDDYFLMNVYGKYNLGKTFNLASPNTLSVFVQADNVLNNEIWLPAWGLAPNQSIPVRQGASILFGLNFAL